MNKNKIANTLIDSTVAVLVEAGFTYQELVQVAYSIMMTGLLNFEVHKLGTSNLIDEQANKIQELLQLTLKPVEPLEDELPEVTEVHVLSRRVE